MSGDIADNRLIEPPIKNPGDESTGRGFYRWFNFFPKKRRPI